MAVHNINIVPPLPPEEHHHTINSIHANTQGMHNQRYDMEGLTQAIKIITISNGAVMAQFSQVTLAIDAIQAQLNTLSLLETRTLNYKY